ncbi:hypothetical protein LRX75_03330 [Rhizobium sp. DKSPLA3]|uniref:Uncharacterized protein n=1 Tax=Rhizobium quercicola TaxID=2901226 RepID=A0A9X1SZJ4_9HYPH|nr:hypothetical protein [Rhizobium quercicola]MCD7108069.1 hypothetical protein [Rhizobium quercicola]
MALNRTALSIAILLVIMFAIGWLVMSPSQNDPAGGTAGTAPVQTPVTPNNPGPTTGTP